MDRFLIAELTRRYMLNERMARAVVEIERPMVLLDDLDAVPQTSRAACVDMISHEVDKIFFDGRNSRWAGLALCTRSEDVLGSHSFGWSRGAYIMVDFLPPDPEQVLAYLQQVESPDMRIAAGLASLARDDELRQLLRMGLLADVAAIAADTSIRGHPLRLFSNSEIASQKRESSPPT